MPPLTCYVIFPSSCHLVTFFFTRRLLNASLLLSNSQTSQSSGLTQEAEDQAAMLIDTYGSYLDIFKCLVCAGKVYSKVLIDKLICLAKHDSQHKVAVKAMQKEKNLIFYKPVCFKSYGNTSSSSLLHKQPKFTLRIMLSHNTKEYAVCNPRDSSILAIRPIPWVHDIAGISVS